MVALLKVAEMFALTGVVALALDSPQSVSYCSGRDKTYIKERPPAGTEVLLLPNSEARIPDMRQRIQPYLNLSAGHRLFAVAQYRKGWRRAWEVVRQFRL